MDNLHTWAPAKSILFPFSKRSSTACSVSKVTNPKPRERLVAWSRMIMCSLTSPYCVKKSLNSSAHLHQNRLTHNKHQWWIKTIMVKLPQTSLLNIKIKGLVSPSDTVEGIPPTKIFLVLKSLLPAAPFGIVLLIST